MSIVADDQFPPPVVDQEDAHGAWRARQLRPNLAEMVWEPTEEGAVAESPLRDQVHEAGAWWAGPGGSMTWQPHEPAAGDEPDPKG